MEDAGIRLLSFSYKDSKGQVSERRLTRWKENSVHIQGHSEGDTFYRTFRKDRVIEYFSSSEYLKFDNAPLAPVIISIDPADVRGEILFTGFLAADRLKLEALAEKKGLRVVKTPTKALAFLCTGKTAGWTKVKAASEKGAFILTEAQLLEVFETGDVSDTSS
jgi:NAD-dependent DNA ligase